MKFKHLLLPLALGVMMLASCGGEKTKPTSGDSTPSGESTPSGGSTTEKVWEYLDFVADGKVRFDVFELKDDLQIGYGGTGRQLFGEGITTLDLQNDATISVTKNLAEEDSFNLIIIAEKRQGSRFAQAFNGIDGDKITTILDDPDNPIGKKLQGYERAYVAISLGSPAKWTKGLNTAMDSYLQTVTTLGSA